MAKTAVMIRLDDDVLSKLDAAAKVLDRSRANVCLLALRDYLAMVDDAHKDTPPPIPRETVATPAAPKPVAPVTDCEHKYRTPDGRCLRPGCGDKR